MISSLSKDLVNKDGIWYSPKENVLSYPEDANDLYFQIEDSSFWFQHRNRCLTSLVKRHSDGETFFDIGGGNGAVSNAIQKAGIQSVLIEPGNKGCNNAKSRGVENIVCATFQDALDENQPISAAGMFDVLEHIEDEQGFLEELSAKMISGSKLYVTVPAYKALWSEEDDQVGHFRRYTLKGLEAVLNQAGFSKSYGTYLFAFLPAPIFLLRSLPSKFGIKRKYNDKETIAKEHGNKETPAIVQSLLNWEFGKVDNAKPVFTGSSCLMVATKR